MFLFVQGKLQNVLSGFKKEQPFFSLTAFSFLVWEVLFCFVLFFSSAQHQRWSCVSDNSEIQNHAMQSSDVLYRDTQVWCACTVCEVLSFCLCVCGSTCVQVSLCPDSTCCYCKHLLPPTPHSTCRHWGLCVRVCSPCPHSQGSPWAFPLGSLVC